MKKFTASVLLFITILCLAACNVPLKKTSARQNGLDSAFTANAVIELEKLRAEGIVKRFGENSWEIEFSSPNSLSGVTLKFAEGTAEASYKGLSFSVPQSAVPVKAMMLNLIRAVDENAHLEQLKGSEKDDSLEVSGDTDGGSYTLTVDSSGMLKGFSMPNYKLNMTFSDIAPIGDAPTETLPETSAETTEYICQ